MASGKTRIQFPLGGLDKRRGYQDQAPFTTPDCMNVWPKDPIRFRERGGSRPGVLRANKSLGASAGSIALLEQVDIIDSTNKRYTYDTFAGSALSSNTWTPLSGGTLPEVSGGLATATYSGGSVTRSALFTTPTDLDTQYLADGYAVRGAFGIFIVPYQGQHWGKYRLYAGLNDATPDPAADGVVAEIDLTGTGGFSGTLKSYLSSSETESATITDPSLDNGNAGWLVLLLLTDTSGTPGTTDGVYQAQLLWNGRPLGTLTDLNADSIELTQNNSHDTYGFSMTAEDDGGICQVAAWRWGYNSNEIFKEVGTRAFWAATVANQSGLYESDLSEFSDSVQDNNGVTLSTDSDAEFKTLESTEYFQDLYIADYGEVIASGTDGVIGGSGTTFDSATYTNWTTVSDLDQYNYCIRVEGQGDFSITAVASGNLTIRESWVAADDTGLTFRIFRSPKQYDSSAGTLSQWRAETNKGVIPCGCRVTASFSDRVWLAGDPELPNIWYCSRKGNARDWDFSAADEDGTRAVASTSAGAFSTIGEPITALIPTNEDYLIFGCTKSIFQLRGDPGLGGSVTNISREIGVVSARSWCRTPEGVIVFLSQDGIYQMAPNSVPVAISRERFPQDLLDIDPNQFWIELVYDIRNRGVWIFVTNKDEVETTHYFMDWQNKSFWPVRFASTDLDPTSALYYKARNYEDQRLYLGCRDGHLRYFHLLAPDDDGNSFIDGDSYIDIGPISLGGMEQDGILREISAALDSDSGAVDWSVKTADTPEEAITATARETGEWTSGQNTVEHPRQRGEAMVLRIAGGDDRPWALERISAVIDSKGRQRL